jgi:hypothetical protein
MAQMAPQGGLLQDAGQALPEQAMPEQAMPVEEAPPQEGKPPIRSQALEMDEEESNNLAIRIERSAKKELYGEMFEDFMDVMQASESIPEDAAVFVVRLLSGNMQAIHSSGKTIPYDHILDTAGEITSEIYDALVQTGIYPDPSDEELERNQATTLTMAVGVIGQQLAKDDALPGEDVTRFMDNLASGKFDEIAQGGAEQPMVPEAPQGQMPATPGQMPANPSQPNADPNQMPVDPNQMPTGQGGYA